MAIKYKWLASKLKEQLKMNHSKGLDKLPSENELCQKYKVSRQTVRQALKILEQDGLIEKRQGSGSFYTGLSLEGTQNIIGLIFPTDQEYDYPNLINDIKHQFEQYGFETKVFLTNYSFETERSILSTLLVHPVRGLLIEGISSAIPNPNMDLYKKIQLSGSEILFLNQPYQTDSSFTYLKDANETGGNLLISYLANQGHTEIAGLFQMDQVSGQERYSGFSTAERQISKHTDWYTTKELLRLRRQHDTAFLKDFIAHVLPGNTAIICDQDEIAYYLSLTLKKAGYKLPDDFAIVTFGNTYYCESEILPLTSLSHKSRETAVLASSMLLDKIKGLPVMSQEIPWNLVVRQSTCV